MTVKLIGKKVDGKRLGFIALVFSAIFFTSSLQVYRDERDVSRAHEKALEKFKLALEDLSFTSRPALLLTAWSECESSSLRTANYKNAHRNAARALDIYQADKDTHESVGFALKAYRESLKILASKTKVKKEKSYYIIHFAGHGYIDTDFKITVNNSADDYSYDRLFLESQWQSGSLSAWEYDDKVAQLSIDYASRFPLFEQIDDKQPLGSKLNTAKQQLTKLQDQVDSLKKQLAQAERTQFEKWFPIVTSIFTALIALSANFIAWRTDRRQSREAELVTLKRQELEQNIIQKDQQIKERNGKIIIPTLQELQRYSKAVPEDRLKNLLR